MDWNQPEEQAGFRRGPSTIVHIQLLKQIIEKTREYNMELHLVFVDFRKAIDTIDYKCLITAFREQRIDKKNLSSY